MERGADAKDKTPKELRVADTKIASVRQSARQIRRKIFHNAELGAIEIILFILKR